MHCPVLLGNANIFLGETMLKVCTLYSGSSGNATLVSDGKTNILIDIGKSTKQTLLALAQLGLSQDDIHALLITHEHIDHIRGVKVFTKNRQIPIYSPKECLDYMYNKEFCNGNSNLKEADKNGFTVGGFTIAPFATMHDSAASCGYSLIQGSKKISVATDLGVMTNAVFDTLKDSDMVVLESNYDSNMLAVGPYPYYLKKRISNDRGHLSNEDCACTVVELAKHKVKKVLLAHLSRENNIPSLAKATTNCALQEAGAAGEIVVEVAPRSEISELIEV